MTFHKVNSKITNLKFTAKEASNEGIVTTVSVDAHLNPLQIGTLAALQDIGHLELSIESDQSTMDFDDTTTAEDVTVKNTNESDPLFKLSLGEKANAEDADIVSTKLGLLEDKPAGKKKEKAVKS